MTTDPNAIRLNREDKELLAKVADKNGQPWREALRNALAQYEQASSEDDGLDNEFMDWCAEEVSGKKIISLEEARRILSKVPGSMADDIIADRGDR